MNWIRPNNPEIDPRALEAEVARTLEKLRAEGKLPAPETSPAPSGDQADDLEYLCRLLDHYSEPVAAEEILSRAGRLGFLLRPLLKFQGRLLRSQKIFNLLAAEIIRLQQEKIRRLQTRRGDS